MPYQYNLASYATGWTPHGVHVERILADPSHFSNTKVALDAFFLKVLLPLLITERKQVNAIGSKTTGIVSQPGAHNTVGVMVKMLDE